MLVGWRMSAWSPAACGAASVAASADPPCSAGTVETSPSRDDLQAAVSMQTAIGRQCGRHRQVADVGRSRPAPRLGQQYRVQLLVHLERGQRDHRHRDHYSPGHMYADPVAGQPVRPRPGQARRLPRRLAPGRPGYSALRRAAGRAGSDTPIGSRRTADPSHRGNAADHAGRRVVAPEPPAARQSLSRSTQSTSTPGMRHAAAPTPTGTSSASHPRNGSAPIRLPPRRVSIRRLPPCSYLVDFRPPT